MSEEGNNSAGNPTTANGQQSNDRDLQFRKMADSFIDIANKHCDQHDPSMISSSFLFGASRFCSFVVAGKTGDKEAYNKQRDAAIEYYAKEFRTMLEQNLDDYSRVFDAENKS